MDSWQRLEAVIKWAGMSTNSFAMHIGLRRAENLYQIKKGNNAISSRLAKQIIDMFPQIDFEWLLRGEGSMVRGQVSQSKPRTTTLPILVGDPANPEFELQVPLQFVDPTLAPGCDVVIRISGAVITNLVPPKSTLFLKRIDSSFIEFGQIHLVVVGNTSYLARIKRGSDGFVELYPFVDGQLNEQCLIESITKIYSLVGYFVTL